jgi:hypothetical protein
MAGHLTHASDQTEDVRVVCSCTMGSGVTLFGALDSRLSNVPVST